MVSISQNYQATNQNILDGPLIVGLMAHSLLVDVGCMLSHIVSEC